MQLMVREMLLEFHRVNNGAKPGRIIFYRDGVSEGQFEKVISLHVAITVLSPQVHAGHLVTIFILGHLPGGWPSFVSY